MTASSGAAATAGPVSAEAVVIQTAFLGDVILTIPLLASLARRHGPVDVVTTPGAAPLLRGHPAVSRVMEYDKRGADRGISGWLRLASGLRAAGYRRAYLPHRSWRSASLVWLAGIPERIGFADSPASLSYTSSRDRDKKLHETRRLLSLSDGNTFEFDLALNRQEKTEAATWLIDHGVTQPFVALAPGSVWGTKRWPGYSHLAAALEWPVVVVGGPSEETMADLIVEAAPERAVSAAGSRTLRQSAAIIDRARVLVTNDSAPLHMAGAVGTPVVAIFGPTVPAFGFGPLGNDDIIVEVTDLECRPCSPHGPMTCPLGHHRCMNDIAAARVAAAVRAVWHSGDSAESSGGETK